MPAYRRLELLGQCIPAYSGGPLLNVTDRISEYYSFLTSSSGTGVCVQFGLLGIVTGVL